MTTYFDPFQIGDLSFPNRIWMPPMTRARATAEGLATPLMADYYRQRADAGLIIAEGSYINAESAAFDHAPGIYTEAQIEAWKPITDAVHQAGGRIFSQLWHCGRASNSDLIGGHQPLSPSGVNDDLAMVNVHGLLASGGYTKLAATPSRAMTLEDIERTIVDYGRAARNAKLAGFDGVEIHTANGYLPHQFLSATLNTRDDKYGGSPENRSRFVMEAFAAIATELPASRIGVRVSPLATYNNVRDPDPATTYRDLVERLDTAGAGYIHASDQNGMFGQSELDKVLALVRPYFKGSLIANGALTPETGAALLASGTAQAISFGRPFIANPDLVGRIRQCAALTLPRPTGWYATGADGYTDYPTL